MWYILLLLNNAVQHIMTNYVHGANHAAASRSKRGAFVNSTTIDKPPYFWCVYYSIIGVSLERVKTVLRKQTKSSRVVVRGTQKVYAHRPGGWFSG